MNCYEQDLNHEPSRSIALGATTEPTPLKYVLISMRPLHCQEASACEATKHEPHSSQQHSETHYLITAIEYVKRTCSACCSVHDDGRDVFSSSRQADINSHVHSIAVERRCRNLHSIIKNLVSKMKYLMQFNNHYTFKA